MSVSAFAGVQVELYYTSHSDPNNRTTYSYAVRVDSPSDIQVNVSELDLTGMAGVLSQGNANYWENGGFTYSSANWHYVRQAPFIMYSTFDIIADDNVSERGFINYTVDEKRGTVEGPVPKTIPGVSVQGVVFFDANRNGSCEYDEFRFDNVNIALNVIETKITDEFGVADFGERQSASYTMEVVNGGPYNLLTHWINTTPTLREFLISDDTIGPVVKYFGFYLNTCLDNIDGDNHTIGFWKHNIKSALQNKNQGIQVSKIDLLIYLAEVENLGPYDIPFDFGTNKLQTAYDYLAYNGSDPVAKLVKQLVAAELNWVSGYSSTEPSIEQAILWYAEWTYNNDLGNANNVASILDEWNNLGE